MPNHLWQPGVSGNPTGRLRGSRNRLSEEVICALLRDFRKHGEKAIAEVRRTQPGVYLKVAALLVPKEHKVEHSNAVSNLSDEELDAMIAHLQEGLERRAAGAKLIEGTVEPTATAIPALAPSPRKRPNRLIEHVNTAIGPRERKPRKRVLPPPGA
jgi:hypothetical protein